MKCAACLLCAVGLAVQPGDSLSRVNPKLPCTPPVNPVKEDFTPKVLKKSRGAAIALETKQESVLTSTLTWTTAALIG